ncbi:MAG: rhodanese-like domain-containing protein, partial [Myxococcales bacterium]|nr:rhodanese-like domain-containing protein [Myxococcales bacterium]
VNSLSAWDFERKRIPGSIRFDTPEAMLKGLRKDDDIVVYCSNVDCRASIQAYHLLVDHGYPRVRRYADGLVDWETAGLPLEGSWANRTDAAPKA